MDKKFSQDKDLQKPSDDSVNDWINELNSIRTLRTTKTNKNDKVEEDKTKIVPEKVSLNTKLKKTHNKPKPFTPKSIDEFNINSVQGNKTQRNKIYKYFLNKWVNDNNKTLDNNDYNGNQYGVLLEEDLINTVDLLKYEEGVEELKVLFNDDKNQLKEIDITKDILNQENKENKENIQASLFDDDNLNNLGEKSNTKNILNEILDVNHKNVIVRIVKPSLEELNTPIKLISEEELARRLIIKIKPQLTDVLSGTLKIMIQKHNQILIKNIYQQVLNEIPSLIEESLSHQLTQILKEINKD